NSVSAISRPPARPRVGVAASARPMSASGAMFARANVQLLACFAVVAAPYGTTLIWRLATRTRRQARLAGRWQALLTIARAYPDARLCRVVRVHQRARTGTKAFVVWLGSGTGSRPQQDAWS